MCDNNLHLFLTQMVMLHAYKLKDKKYPKRYAFFFKGKNKIVKIKSVPRRLTLIIIYKAEALLSSTFQLFKVNYSPFKAQVVIIQPTHIPYITFK